MNLTLLFLCLVGYYVPKSDGEFYQFCYVTHTGDIRGASTPFQFRSSTPTEELLTVTEDDSNSDILVVTTKTGLLEVGPPSFFQFLSVSHLSGDFTPNKWSHSEALVPDRSTGAVLARRDL